MAAEFLVLALLPALLALAAGWDVASLTIPNFIPLAVLVAFAAFSFIVKFPPQLVVGHLLAGLIGLVCGFALFALGFVGGGDAKLFACTLVWMGIHSALQYVLVVSLFGGGLAILIVSLRAVPFPQAVTRQPWIARLYDPKGGLPYGVALAFGGVAIIPYTDVFRAAAGG